MKSNKIKNELNVNEFPLIKNILFCIKNTIDHYPLLLVWCLLAIVTNVGIAVLSTFLPKVVIEKMTGGENLESLVTVTLVFMLSIAVLSGFKRFWNRYIYHHKFKMNTYYQFKIANKGMTTDYCNQEKEQFRKLQTESFNACNGHYSSMAQVYDVMITLLSSISGITVFLGILLKLNITIVLVLIATTLISYVLNKQIIKWSAKHSKEKIDYQQKMNYISNVSGDIKSAKDIRLYHMSEWLEDIYRNNIKGFSGWYKRYASKAFGISLCGSGLQLLREGVAYTYLLYLVLTQKIGVADFVLYFGVITGFTLWLGEMFGEVNTLNRISLAVNYLRAFLEFPETYIRDGGVEITGIDTTPKEIRLKNVSYRYDGADNDTLKNIDLTIKPGEHLAIVGLNGSGKTTLVKLICGLTDPTEGAIYYDGIDLKEYNRRSFYKLFSVVFQQHSILPVTIEQIVAESVSENIDGMKVEQCLRQAGLWEKISSLPKKTKSEYGKMIYDEGIELSGGEIQKLLLARALYKGAPVMILDEPTAALDPIAESKLYETYNELMSQYSSIFISHRLASTRFCDRILLIENGSIVEEGTHDTLLSKKGKYYEMYEMQAKYYREKSMEKKISILGKNCNVRAEALTPCSSGRR